MIARPLRGPHGAGFRNLDIWRGAANLSQGGGRNVFTGACCAMGRPRRNWEKSGGGGVATLDRPQAPRAGASSSGRRFTEQEERINKARQAFGRDPAAAISSLERLRREHPPDPLVLHALCVMHQKNGDVARAVEVAREAFPLCFRRGLGFLAAEIFDTLEADAATLGLHQEELLALGGALGRTVYWRLGFRALGSVLIADPGCEPAAIELLRMAEHQLERLQAPAEALAIFQFLAAVAPESPLRSKFDEGLRAAERALGPCGATK